MSVRPFPSSLLLGLSLLAILLIGAVAVFIGIEYTDTGFVLGLAHRVALGQRIYFDFDYVRPPITPLLWSLPLSLEVEAKEVLIRFLVFAQKIATAFLLYITLRKFELNQFLSLSAAIITFGFLAHHISMMPWHTTDGLFFSAIAVTLYAWNVPIAALLFAIMAAMTKQSFYPLPILIFIFSTLSFPKSRFLLVFTTLLVALGLFLNPYFTKFTQITSETTSLRDLVSAAILPHLKLNKWSGLFLVCMLSALIIFKRRSLSLLLTLGIIFPLLNLWYQVVYSFFSTGKSGFAGTGYGVTHVAMTLSLLHVLFVAKEEKLFALRNKRLQVSILLLAAAWMSTISWGYANYLFTYGFLLTANLLLLKEEGRLTGHVLISLSVITLISFFFLRLAAPYRMDSPLLAKHEMVKAGHYKYVWASATDFQKLNSIEKISVTKGCKDTYPSVPQFALIRNDAPLLRADWKMDVEFPSYKDAQILLEQEDCKLFVEKDKRVIGWQGKFKSSAVDLDAYKHCATEFDAYFYFIDFSTCKPK